MFVGTEPDIFGSMRTRLARYHNRLISSIQGGFTTVSAALLCWRPPRFTADLRPTVRSWLTTLPLPNCCRGTRENSTRLAFQADPGRWGNSTLACLGSGYGSGLTDVASRFNVNPCCVRAGLCFAAERSAPIPIAPWRSAMEGVRARHRGELLAEPPDAEPVTKRPNRSSRPSGG